MVLQHIAGKPVVNACTCGCLWVVSPSCCCECTKFVHGLLRRAHSEDLVVMLHVSCMTATCHGHKQADRLLHSHDIDVCAWTRGSVNQANAHQVEHKADKACLHPVSRLSSNVYEKAAGCLE